VSADAYEVAAVSGLVVVPTVTEIIEGPVAAVDRVYAFDRVRDACRSAPRTVRRARARLFTQPHPTGRWPSIAEGTLILDGGVVVCAGVAAGTLREAIDLLTARLRRRLRGLGVTPPRQPIFRLPANASSSVSLNKTRTVRRQSPRIGMLTPDAM
jgi:hypothetical protein